MPFEWKEIDNNWLYSLPIRHPKEIIIDAFNSVEDWLGTNFFSNYEGPRGQYITTLILDLYELIEKRKKGCFILPYKGEIIHTLKDGNIMRLDTVIRLAAYYLRHNYSVESEPEVIIDGSLKRPDLKVCLKENCIFIEESAYNISERQKEIFSLQDEILKILDSLKQSIWIEISILKDNLTKEEIIQIMKKSITMSNYHTQPQIIDIEGISTIVTYGIGQEKPVFDTVRPALGLATVKVGGGVELHLNILVPFTDERIYKMLDKSAQLPEKEYNLIILDASVSGDLERLSYLAKEFLQPDVHRKISAVLFIQKRYYINEVKIETRLITHPNPFKPLPKEFLQITMEYFKNNPIYMTRKVK